MNQCGTHEPSKWTNASSAALLGTGTLNLAMGEPSGTPDEVRSGERDRGPARADAVASRERILDAAAALPGDRTSMIEIAAAAGVGRSTLYRHFSSRQALERALQQRAIEMTGASGPPGGRIATLPFRAPGQLGREGPLTLEVTHVLDEVPPHLVPDQLVAEARRAAGVAVALYVVDIDGSQLVRLAGSDNFPEELEAPPALGPEIVPEGLAAYETRLRQRLPGCVAEPLWLRGRVTALFLCIGTPVAPLEDIAKQGAAALELAERLHGLHRGETTAETDDPGRGDPAEPFPTSDHADRRRAVGGRAPADLRSRWRLVRLRRKP